MEKVQILDVAAGTGMAGVEVGKKTGSFASSLFSFCLFKVFVVGVGGGGGGLCWGIYRELSATQRALQLLNA